MKPIREKITFMTRCSSVPMLFALLLIGEIAIADNIDEALRAAYQHGYDDGYKAGEAGGSQGGVVGIRFPKNETNGGSSSGYEEAPWVMKYDDSENAWQLLDFDKSNRIEKRVYGKDISDKFVKQFKARGKTFGTIVVEDVPIKDIGIIDDIFKRTDKSRIWVAPSGQ